MSPSRITLTANEAGKEKRFSINYDCKQLMSKTSKYYDTVKVKVNSGEFNADYEYLVICDASQMRGFDINFLILFGIAVLVIVVVIKTPPFLIFNEMTSEEQ